MAKEAETKKAAEKNSPAPGESFSKIEDELEDDDDLEEEEEDEDEDDAAARSLRPAPPPHGHGPVAHAKLDEAADATWWVPHAILGTLVMVGVLGFFGAFTSVLAPVWQKVKRAQPATSASASAAPSAAAPAASAPKPTAAPTVQRPRPTASVKAQDPNPSFGARRILVTFKGAKNAKEDTKRTKDEAKKRADDAAKKLAGGAKFEEVAGEFSDEPGAKGTGGNMGRFKRDAFNPAIIGAVEKLQVGATSGVFESPFGYEILMRLE